LQRLENVHITLADRTALHVVLQAGISTLVEFGQGARAAKEGQLRGGTKDLRRGVEQLGDAVNPEDLATAMAPRFTQDGIPKSGDWRPLAKAITRVQRLPEILDEVVVWERVFPDAMERATGLQREELRSHVLAFVPRIVEEQPGDWTEEELSAAERIIQQNVGLQQIFARAETLKSETADAFRGLWVVPVVLLLLAIAVVWCLSSVFGGGAGVSTTTAPLNQVDVQGLPLLKLEK